MDVLPQPIYIFSFYLLFCDSSVNSNATPSAVNRLMLERSVLQRQSADSISFAAKHKSNEDSSGSEHFSRQVKPHLIMTTNFINDFYLRSAVPSLSMIDSAEQPFSAHNIPSTSEGATETTTNAIGLADIWKKLTEIDAKIDTLSSKLDVVDKKMDNLARTIAASGASAAAENVNSSPVQCGYCLPGYVTMGGAKLPVKSDEELQKLEEFAQSEEGSLRLGKTFHGLSSKTAYDLLRIAVENLFGHSSRYTYTGRAAPNSRYAQAPLAAKALHITDILLDTVISKFNINRPDAVSEFIKALSNFNEAVAMKKKRREEQNLFFYTFGNAEPICIDCGTIRNVPQSLREFSSWLSKLEEFFNPSESPDTCSHRFVESKCGTMKNGMQQRCKFLPPTLPAELYGAVPKYPGPANDNVLDTVEDCQDPAKVNP
ncbi:uncharacterized protein LOC128746398 [Sabethes cyaneus]|uniref:uncharacterized protein LOC128746398 n=1 Tax=Sabethes cyaneus TaxID=53552 RepID=UPI00237EE433|nr:uncharacterized protein LOC128746398 [Sabethes cyaneus]